MNASILQVRSLSLHLKFFMVAAVCALAFCAMPAPAHAAGLTDTQISAVLGLLSAFDVPQATIDNVSALLRGQSEGAAPVSVLSQPAQPMAYAPAQPMANMPPMPPSPPAPGYMPAAYQPGLDASSLVASVAMVPLSATTDSLNLIADQVNEVNYALASVLSAYVDLFSLDSVAQAAAATVVPPVASAHEAAGESLGTTLAYLPQSLYETAGNTTDFLAAVEMAPIYVITDRLSNALFKAGLY